MANLGNETYKWSKINFFKIIAISIYASQVVKVPSVHFAN